MIRYLEALRSWMWSINNNMNCFKESNNIGISFSGFVLYKNRSLPFSTKFIIGGAKKKDEFHFRANFIIMRSSLASTSQLHGKERSKTNEAGQLGYTALNDKDKLTCVDCRKN